MCSTDFEMLVSHSPPVFSHSPPTGNFLTEYAALRLGADTFPRAANLHACRQLQHSNSWSSFSTKPAKKSPSCPRRPCLVIRPSEEPLHLLHDPLSPTKLKKRVVFADDKGMSLTQVRVMTEPSNVPPLWSYRFLAEVTRGLSAEPIGVEEPWEITFPQPASDYVIFRKQLDSKKVSLENVIVKEADKTIQGTVKVKNESYEKEVFVRTSTNNWQSYEDYYCNFVSNNLSSSVGSAYVLYDTFSFSIPLPPKSNKIEFCVCFKYGSKEYWDNNDEKNYVIVKKIITLPKSSLIVDCFERKASSSEPKPIPGKFPEATQAKFDSWSEFASWTHLENSNPYW